MSKGFVISSQAWYADKANCKEPEMLLAVYADDGSTTTGELSVEETAYGLQLKTYEDGAKALLQMPEVLEAMVTFNSRSTTGEADGDRINAFAKCLEEKGYTDMTQRDVYVYATLKKTGEGTEAIFDSRDEAVKTAEEEWAKLTAEEKENMAEAEVYMAGMRKDEIEAYKEDGLSVPLAEFWLKDIWKADLKRDLSQTSKADDDMMACPQCGGKEWKITAEFQFECAKCGTKAKASEMCRKEEQQTAPLPLIAMTRGGTYFS